jgi:beta-glucosidase
VLAGLASLAAATSVPRFGLVAAEDGDSRFPDGFVWGVAASAPQTETANGRGASVWDLFAATPGTIKDGSDMRITTAFDEMYTTDFGLVADAGIKAYRFSFAWPRLQPDGKGKPSQHGLDLYDRILDAMLARGLEPWATTFHWDIPAALGDWRSRDLAYRYGDYAQVLAERFGDRVHRWMLLNEPNVVALLGYAYGNHAPGIRSRDAYLGATHHQNLAQGLGFQALRQNLPSDRRIGTALSVLPVRPSDDSGSNRDAADALDAAWNRAFLDPLFGRPYPPRLQSAMEPLVHPDDMRTIAASPDFLGVNYYSRLYAAAVPESPIGAQPSEAPSHLDRTNLGWPIEPDGLQEVLRMLKEDYGNVPTIITEFGASFADPSAENGIVADPRRIDYIRRHLTAIRAAILEGSRVKGAFYWSATDNWEWGFGFTEHFGLIQIDRTTLQRAPKQSLHYLGECARRNAVI